MEMFTFDRAERSVTQHGSIGVTATRIARGAGAPGSEGEGEGGSAGGSTGGSTGAFLAHLSVAAGGVVGTHPATGAQLFLLLTGSGWVAGPDGIRVPIAAGQGVRWEQGELHTSGTATGFTALALDGPALHLFAPES